MNVTNINDIAYEALLAVIDFSLDNKESVSDNLIKFVTDETYLADIITEAQAVWKFDIRQVKVVSMLMLFEFAYLLNLYDAKRQVNEDLSLEMLEKLEGLNSSDIVSLFSEDSDLIVSTLEDAAAYLDNTYVFRYCCWANLVAEHKQEILFRINPFAILEEEDCVLGDGFKEMEATIQLFNNFYDRALEKQTIKYNLEEADGELSNNESLVSDFWKIVAEYFQENTAAIYEFYSLVFANVYEYMVTYKPTSKKEIFQVKSICEELEKTPLSTLISRFLNDYEFALKIIDSFLSINDLLEKDVLVNRRQEFIESGKDPQKLKKFNPYYQHDEQVLKRLKNNSSN